jgi:hypothetical protein
MIWFSEPPVGPRAQRGARRATRPGARRGGRRGRARATRWRPTTRPVLDELERRVGEVEVAAGQLREVLNFNLHLCTFVVDVRRKKKKIK